MNVDFTPPTSPWDLFRDWYALAQDQEPSYPDCMMLATVGSDGMPSLRAVLMKDYDPRGVVFYTNRDSRKGRALATHAQASVCFYWKSIQRQVRIEGLVEPTSDAESNAYFATRPRGSQIGAWASQQSQVLASRAALEQRAQEIGKHYEGREVPRPPHWGGYRLAPAYFEFWQERQYRLHDRIAYINQNGAWKNQRLYP